MIDNLLLQDYSPEQIKGRMNILGKDMSVMSGYISISGRTRSKEENYTSTYAEMGGSIGKEVGQRIPEVLLRIELA